MVLTAYIQTEFPSLHYRYDKRCAQTAVLSTQIVACANRLCEVVEMNGRQLNQLRQARVRRMQDPATACRSSRPQTKRWQECHRFIRVYGACDLAQLGQGGRRRTVTNHTPPASLSVTSGLTNLHIRHNFHLPNHTLRNTQHVFFSRSGVQYHEPINQA